MTCYSPPSPPSSAASGHRLLTSLRSLVTAVSGVLPLGGLCSGGPLPPPPPPV